RYCRHRPVVLCGQAVESDASPKSSDAFQPLWEHLAAGAPKMQGCQEHPGSQEAVCLRSNTCECLRPMDQVSQALRGRRMQTSNSNLSSRRKEDCPQVAHRAAAAFRSRLTAECCKHQQGGKDMHALL